MKVAVIILALAACRMPDYVEAHASYGWSDTDGTLTRKIPLLDVDEDSDVWMVGGTLGWNIGEPNREATDQLKLIAARLVEPEARIDEGIISIPEPPETVEEGYALLLWGGAVLLLACAGWVGRRALIRRKQE